MQVPTLLSVLGAAVICGCTFLLGLLDHVEDSNVIKQTVSHWLSQLGNVLAALYLAWWHWLEGLWMQRAPSQHSTSDHNYIRYTKFLTGSTDDK